MVLRGQEDHRACPDLQENQEDEVALVLMGLVVCLVNLAERVRGVLMDYLDCRERKVTGEILDLRVL